DHAFVTNFFDHPWDPPQSLGKTDGGKPFFRILRPAGGRGSFPHRLSELRERSGSERVRTQLSVDVARSKLVARQVGGAQRSDDELEIGARLRAGGAPGFRQSNENVVDGRKIAAARSKGLSYRFNCRGGRAV